MEVLSAMGRTRICATFRPNGLDGESEGMECLLGVANPFNGDENVDELAYGDDPDWNRFVLGGDDELGESKMSRGRLSMRRGRITGDEMRAEPGVPLKSGHKKRKSSRVRLRRLYMPSLDPLNFGFGA